jgi:hypothetical protein
VFISKFGRVMTHKPSSGAFGNSDDLKELVDLLATIEPVLVDMYSAKTGKTKDEATAAFFQDKDTWFTASQAIAAGLADEQYDGPEVEVEDAADTKKIFAVYATIKANFKTNNNMRQISAAAWAKICAQLGITDAADDGAVESAIKKIVDKANKHDMVATKLETAQTELTSLKAATVTAQVNGMLDSAMTSKKINAQQKTLFGKQYADNPEGLKEVLATMGAFVSVGSQLQQTENERGGDNTPEVVALMAKGWDELMKTGEMAQLKAASQEAYVTMYKKKYGFGPNEKPNPKSSSRKR